MASDEMLSWLRSTIEGDKALAEVAAFGERYGVAYTGHWTFTDGDDLVYQHGRRIPGGAGIVGRSCDCCGPASVGHALDLMHIATHDPRDTIARCEAELSVLDLFEKQGFALGGAYFGALHDALGRLALGYRHREGFNPGWVSD